MKLLTRLPEPGVWTIDEIEWPNEWPMPRQGEVITLSEPARIPGRYLVTEVTWSPFGDRGADSIPHPYVWVNLIKM